MTRNDKKLCLSHSKSQEAYIIWSWILVHKNKMMKFPDSFFSFFFKFWFPGLLERSKCKKWPKMTKNSCVFHYVSQKSYLIWFWFFGMHVWNDDVSSNFFHFFKILIFWILPYGSGRGKSVIEGVTQVEWRPYFNI